MASSSHVERQPRHQGAVAGWIRLGARLSRVVRGRADAPDSRRKASGLVRWFAPLRRAIARVIRIGAKHIPRRDTRKRLRLCNMMALCGAVIMAVWAALEAPLGSASNLP